MCVRKILGDKVNLFQFFSTTFGNIFFPGICNEPHSSPNDTPCSFDFECISDMCGCPEGCGIFPHLLPSHSQTFPNASASPPFPTTSHAIPATQLPVPLDTVAVLKKTLKTTAFQVFDFLTFVDLAAICTEAASHKNGGSCLDNMDCVTGLRCGPSNQCILPYSVAIGSKCKYYEDCVFGAGCEDGECKKWSGR